MRLLTTILLATTVLGTVSMARAQGSPGARPTLLRAGVLTSQTEPFVVWADQKPRDGVQVRLLQAMAARLGLTLELVALPPLRLRAALQAGEIDVVCGIDGQRAPDRDQLDLTPAVFELTEVLVGHPESPRVEQLDGLAQGTAVGAVQGLASPVLDGRVADGRLRREDALGEDRLVRKLAARRHPYALMLQPAASAGRARGEDLAPWAVPVDHFHYQCGLSKRSALTLAQWNAALGALRQSDQFAELSRGSLSPGFAWVVSRQSGLKEVPEQALIDAFLARRRGVGVQSSSRLLMLGGPLRNEVTRVLFGRAGSDYRAAWTAQQYGGGRAAPEELDDPYALRALLKQDPTAIGVLPLWAIDAGLRVLAFR